MSSSFSEAEVQASTIGPIRAVDFCRYAVSVGDLNQLYFNPEVARAAGYRDVIAPPNYLSSVQDWTPGLFDTELQNDGIDPACVPEAVRGMRMMGGGHDLEFGEPVYPGDVLTRTRRLEHTFSKPSKMGELKFAVYEITFINQDGALVLKCRETIIAAPHEG